MAQTKQAEDRSPFPYHPEYGIPDEDRMRAVTLAKAAGFPAAAESTGFGQSSIYRWAADMRRQDAGATP